MKADCNGCGLKRTVTEYDLSHRGPGTPQKLCLSCADTLGVYELMHSAEGKLLLTINSKLDLLMRRHKR
jgi:hypothetical protein